MILQEVTKKQRGIEDPKGEAVVDEVFRETGVYYN